MIKKSIFIFIVCIFFLLPVGFFAYLINSIGSQPIYPEHNITYSDNLSIKSPKNLTIIEDSSYYEIIRVPQTFGLKPGESGVTPEDPYGMTPPLKLSNIPYVKGVMYNNNLTIILQDIINANREKDIVVSYGDTYCGACIGATKIFSDFYNTYGDIVKFISIMENDTDRISILINKYSLNPDVIFVSSIRNLKAYHQETLQGYMYIPIIVHISPEGVVDRINIGPFRSEENLMKFIGIEVRKVGQ